MPYNLVSEENEFKMLLFLPLLLWLTVSSNFLLITYTISHVLAVNPLAEWGQTFQYYTPKFATEPINCIAILLYFHCWEWHGLRTGTKQKREPEPGEREWK